MNQAILNNTPVKPPLTSASRAMAMLEINTHLAKLSDLPADHPDAGLILICQQHPRNIEAFNADPEDSGSDNPIWVEYERTLDAIDDANPLTLAGKVAKALAAKAEALEPDGDEHPANCPAEDWAWDLVNDLIRENETPTQMRSWLDCMANFAAIEMPIVKPEMPCRITIPRLKKMRCWTNPTAGTG